jgi:Ca2+-transporting ATPase
MTRERRGSAETEMTPAKDGSAGASTPWHVLSAAEVLERLGASPGGLTSAEAAARLARHGPNLLVAARPVSAWTILVAQFRSVVVLLLVAATVIALAIGDLSEAVAIAAVLAINTAIGFGVELRARRVMEALLGHRVPEATVTRDAAERRLGADVLVPGDVVHVGEGEWIPADARLLDAVEARTSEAALTGESTPVEKRVEPLADPDAPLAERTSMLYAGTALATGSARAVVVATGMDTELGRVGRLLAHIEKVKTPLERRLDQLGTRLVWLTLGIAGVVVAVGLRQGQALAGVLQTALALAIAAVPEGLPAVATIALAVGLRRMAKRQAAVRRLGAVEALGSTTVVCTDKTGTLTAGEMTATRVVGTDVELAVTGVGFGADGEILMGGAPLAERGAAEEAAGAASHPLLRPLLLAAALTPRANIDPAGRVIGDPTDAALVVLARKGGLQRQRAEEELPPVGELPFSSERGLSASYHRGPRGRVAFVKGAPGLVLDLSTRAATRSGDAPLTGALRKQVELRNEQLAREGLRVIALAWREDADGDTGPRAFRGGVDRGAATGAGSGPRALPEPPRDLTFLALVGIMDPPAEGVADTVNVFRSAGIRTVMITGDQAATAAAVGRAVGIADHGAATLHGRDVGRMNPAELVEAAGRTVVFSRVSPSDKLNIVTAFQERGEIVAMLGDGVNDAAALKKADVSVAMGVRGTDLAKETADLVLRDDRFATIGAAIEEGRIVYDNVRKFVFFLFSCNVAEVLVVLGASVAGLPLPLLPLQILWLNLVTDTFPALALAVEPGEPGLMRRPPRKPGQSLLSRGFLTSLTFFAALITGCTLAAFLWGLGQGTVESAVTMSFTTLAFAQLLHLGNARSRGPVLAPARVRANPWALAAVPLVIALQLLALYWPPLAGVLSTVPLTGKEWLVVAGLSLVPAVVGQGVRSVRSARGS